MCPNYVQTNLSTNALKGDGSEFKVTDHQIKKGITPKECAEIIIRSVFDRKLEVWICPFYYHLAIPLLEIFPSFHAWYLLKRLKGQLESIKG